MVKISCLLQRTLVVFIRIYQVLIRAVLKPACRFYPSCSEYAVQSIQQQGSLQGMYLTLKRLLRCHPWHPGGYDPVPHSPLKQPTITS
jgi:uncharacterized protein